MIDDKIISLSVHDTTVMFTAFPDFLRGTYYLFTTTKGYMVYSSCSPELIGNYIYVCGKAKNCDRRELVFNTVEQTEDFVNSLERFCLDRGISFSFDGKRVLGGL